MFKRISSKKNLDRWCVELGAWDGEHLSNTCNLIRNHDYRAVLIEGDATRFDLLRQTFPDENILKICRFVRACGEDSLDNILSTTPIPRNFDFLSVDIDGNDYHILSRLNGYRPKVVCVEFNPTIPNAVDYFQENDFYLKRGSSARAFYRLGGEIGYDVVAATDCNVILVEKSLSQFVLDRLPELTDLNPRGNDATYIFVGFDGSLISNKRYLDFKWHRTRISLNDIQPIPKAIRVYPGDYTPIQSVLFKIWRMVRNGRGIKIDLVCKNMKERLRSYFKL